MVDKHNVLIILQIIASALSLLGTLFVILTYLTAKELRSPAFRLVFLLQVSDLILSIGHVINFQNGENSSPNYLWCRKIQTTYLISKTQAFIVNFAAESSLFWTVFIAYNIYATIVKNNAYQRRYIQYIIAVFIPICLSIYPLFLDIYGPELIICWIQPHGNIGYRLINFMIILWVSIIINVVLYIKTWKFIKELFKEDPKQTTSSRKLILYPLILVLSWFFELINLFVDIQKNHIGWIDYLAVFFSGLQGFLNSIAYGLNPQVKNYLRNIFTKTQIVDQVQNIEMKQEMKKSRTQSVNVSQSTEEAITKIKIQRRSEDITAKKNSAESESTYTNQSSIYTEGSHDGDILENQMKAISKQAQL